MALELTEFIRKPFIVEATLVTEENLEEIAALVGEVKVKPDGVRYIAVDKHLVPNVWRVFPGYYMTKMGERIRCYSPKIFGEQFTTMDGDTRRWVEFVNAENT